MVNLKEQTKHTSPVAKKGSPVLEHGDREQNPDPLIDILNRAQSTYAAYIEAQKEVGNAYKEREQQLEKNYKHVYLF